jgi:hypothetical protein
MNKIKHLNIGEYNIELQFNVKLFLSKKIS